MGIKLFLSNSITRSVLQSALFLTPLFSFGQEDPPSPVMPETRVVNSATKDDQIFEMFDIDVPPSFPGGDSELLKFLAEHIYYPDLARENNIQGIVTVGFIVETCGHISNVSIVKDIGAGCGLVAKYAVLEMPKWTPGQAGGRAVKVRFTLPVRFKLE